MIISTYEASNCKLAPISTVPVIVILLTDISCEVMLSIVALEASIVLVLMSETDNPDESRVATLTRFILLSLI